MGLKRAMDVIPRSELQDLPTGALLARLKRLRWCEDTSDWSDLSKEEIASVDGQILFKSDPRWHQAYADLKAILQSREHLSNKP